MKGEVLIDGQGGHQVKLLKHQGDGVAAQPRAAPVIEPGERGAIESDFTAVESVERADEMQKGALAATAFAGERKRVAGLQRKADATQNRGRGTGIGLGQVLDIEQHRRLGRHVLPGQPNRTAGGLKPLRPKSAGWAGGSALWAQLS